MKNLGSFLYGLLVLGAMLFFAAGMVWRALKKSEDPGRLLYKWVITLVVGGFMLVTAAGSGLADMGSAFVIPILGSVCGVILGIMWAPNIGAMVAAPFMALYDGGNQEPEMKPLYSMAEARRKQGRYQEAIIEVRKQLQRFPENFQGWMLLAEIQADDLKDMHSAADIVERIISYPEHAPINVAYALTRLADWHLKHTLDRDAAREALQRIIDLYPDTDLSHGAAQRIAHLGSKEHIGAAQDRKPIQMKTSDEKLGLAGQVVSPVLREEDPAELAQKYVKQLEEHPFDNEAREKLALIYAEHYQRLDLALDQLEQLIAVPQQSSRNVAHCLNLVADLQIKLENNVPGAKLTLERIVSTFPNTAYAANAEKRIALLGLQGKSQQKSQVIKLGSYEQNLGLKGKGSQQP